MRCRLAAFVIPFALAACSGGGGADADNDGEITTDEATAEMQQGPDIAMNPGKWEQSVRFTDIDIPGAPQAMKDMMRQNMSATVSSDTCLSQEEVAEPTADFFAGKGNGDCKYDEFDRTGGHMKMRMTCTDPQAGKSEVSMEGDFGAESYSFDIASTMHNSDVGTMSMKGTVSGKRVGECTG